MLCGSLSVQGRISAAGCMTLSPSDCLHSICVSHETYRDAKALTHRPCTCGSSERVCVRARASVSVYCSLYFAQVPVVLITLLTLNGRFLCSNVNTED